ncbi:Zinc transporter ZIP1 [Eumeta japonica]|uniref:Zinc transporter ZIP1 n=1 Tax=Eumeta variegata TaxID=151549 RepID=A0A4C1SPX0_EUMVA|nr:Zinc transporter ZIP1 [Eumeta japonica]
MINRVRQYFKPDYRLLFYKPQAQPHVESYCHLRTGTPRYRLLSLDRIQRKHLESLVSGQLDSLLRSDVASLRMTCRLYYGFLRTIQICLCLRRRSARLKYHQHHFDGWRSTIVRFMHNFLPGKPQAGGTAKACDEVEVRRTAKYPVLEEDRFRKEIFGIAINKQRTNRRVQTQSIGRMREFDFELTPLLTCCGFFVMYFVEELVHLYIDHREKKHGGAAPLVRNLSIRRSGPQNVTNSTADLIDADAAHSKGIEAHGHSHTHGHSHMPIAAEGDDKVTAALRGLLIVLALSVHELFEGLAVGLESSTSHVWYMLGAISAHKLVIAFCIGVELLATKTKTWLAIIYITTFAIVSPLGIGIGILLVGGQGATAAGVYSVVLQGLASGTLLYVIFFEIWRNDRTGMLQFATAVVGFVIMFGLQLLTGHSHSHSHGGDDDHGHDHGHSHD